MLNIRHVHDNVRYIKEKGGFGMNTTIIKEKIKSLDKMVLYGATAIALVSVLGTAYYVMDGDDSHAGQALAENPVHATAITVEPQIVNSVISTSGALASKNSSVLSSKIMGRVVYLGAKEGDYVGRGRLLIKIESGEISAQLYQAQAAYNNAKLQYNRIKQLYDEHAATQMEMDQATLGLESAEAGLNAAKAMESYTTITAPISGQIVEKRINLGEMALPGQPLIRIEDNKSLRLEVTVKEQDILAVQPGDEVLVRIDAMPGRDIKGRVAQVVQASDVRTHSFLVKVDVPQEKGLITGMYGRAFFATGRREAILVPRSAVVTMAGVSGVYVVSSEGNAVFQMVQLGEEYNDKVEVLTGLKSGDKVITDNKEGRIEGRKVILALN